MSRTICLILMLIAYRLDAQPSAGFVALSANEGLSQGMVFDILQTRDGFLWIATKDGLNRYDGYGFEVFSNDPFNPFSIGGNEVRSLFEDSRGRLWVAYPNGLDVYEPTSGHFFHVLDGQKLDLEWLGLSLVEDKDGTIWSFANEGIVNECIIKLKLKDNELEQALAQQFAFPTLEFSKIEWPAGTSPKFNSIRLGPNNHLYCGSENGLYRIDISKNKPALTQTAFPGEPLIIMEGGEPGKLYLQGKDWISSFVEGNAFAQKIPYSSLGVTCLDGKGNLWDIYPNKFRKYHLSDILAGKKQYIETALTANIAQYDKFYFTSLYFDNADNLWTGTNGYGLRKYVHQYSNFHLFFNGKTIGSMLETPDGGVVFRNDPTKIFYGKHVEKSQPNSWFSNIPPSLIVVYFLFDKNGNCWATCASLVGHERKLCRIDAASKAVVTFPFKGDGLAIGRDGRMLSVSPEGLYEMDISTGKYVLHPFGFAQKKAISSNNYQSRFYPDANGTVWIYEFEGLIQASPSPQGYQFRFFKNDPDNQQSLSNNFVLSVAEDPLNPDQYLWVGTKGGGLNRLDRKTGQFMHFKKEQGLPDKVVYGILPDNSGHLWLSTNKGLCRFNAKTETTKNFTVADGLQNNEFNSASFLKLKDGTMLFGGVNGLNSFHPDSLNFNRYVPQIAITRFLVNGKLVPHYQATVFSHDQNQVSIEFAAMDFTNPGQNSFRFRLVGVDKNWVNLGVKNSVQFVNLAPGRYDFQVQGANNDGVWSNEIASLSFTIRPPWWHSKLAYILYLLAFLAAIYAAYRFQINRVNLRNQLAFEHREAGRLAELDRIKTNFFSNVTHEFRTPLTLILEPVRQMLAEDGSGQFRERLQLVSRNSERLLQLVNQLLDLAKLESGKWSLDLRQGQLMETIRPIYQSFLPQAEKKGIELKMRAPQELPTLSFDKKIVETVVTNLLSNALKFTENGTVTLSLDFNQTADSGHLELAVSDTGLGIPGDALPHIFDRFYQVDGSATRSVEGTGIGLALTKELVERMGGHIHVESEVGRGTKFTVRLPMKLDAGTASPADNVSATFPELVEAATFENKATPPNHAIGKLVLLLEDNTELRHFIKATLEKHYQVVEASNGQEGVKKALELIPDLVISDLMMPEKNGFEVCNELKNNELTSHVPFILLTAKSSLDSKLQGLRTGADEYLNKPFHTEELLVRMENLLETRRRLQEKFSANPGIGSKKTEAFFPKMDNDFLRKFSLLIEQNLSDEKITVEDFAAKLHISRVQLHRKLTALTNQSATEFIRNYRLDRAMELLKNKEGNVSQVAFMVGFGSEKYFSTTFKERFGYSPSEVA